MTDWADANPGDPSTWPIEWSQTAIPDPVVAMVAAAQGVRDLYMAYIHVGFDPAQALAIVCTLLHKQAR